MNVYSKQFRFDNGYAASVICNDRFYRTDSGLFEVAVIGPDGEVCCTTPVTGDVLANLDFQEVADALRKIEALPPASN